MAWKSFPNLCVNVYSSDVNQNVMRTSHVLKKGTETRANWETATEPFRCFYSQKDAKLYRRICVHFKMQVHCSIVVLLLFFFYIVCVARSLFNLLQALWTGSFLNFIDCFFFFFLALGTGLFTFLWAWSTLDLHFLILEQVVSIMCEKCLLYSFMKFQSEYKSLYKYLSTYYRGVLSVGWVAPSDYSSFCLRTPEEGFFCFCQWENQRQNSLSRCKGSDCTSLLLFCFTFEYWWTSCLWIKRTS